MSFAQKDKTTNSRKAIMGFEIDFLAVGDGEKSGDAIAVRWGNLSGSRVEQRILVIDGGTLEAGQNLVDHIKTYYKTDSVDAVISTHPDIDHACGLKEGEGLRKAGFQCAT